MNISWIDVKLGVRMLVKYPGLSLVAVSGMALAIAIGAGYFAAFGAMLDSTLPIEQGERAVVVRNRTVSGPDAGDIDPASPEDFERWRGQLKSIEMIGAFRDDRRNLIAADGRAQEVRVAAITASGFRFTGVSPLLGRTLLDEDERPGAPPVVVISWHEWQREFAADPRILDRPIRLDDTVHTIVGVMPEGFAFPIRHRYWVPLPAAPQSVQVFGRLAAGFTMSDARAELATAGDQMAAAFPRTHATLRPHAIPYTHAFLGPESPEEVLSLRGLQFGIALLLVIVAVNVAILVYARTATRGGEIVVRTALGATRGRVVTQLFAEALMLSLASAAIGLTIAGAALRYMQANMSETPESQLPYWVDFNLSPATILYAAALAVLAGVIVGVLPALKATGKHVQAGLQQFSARAAGLQLGRTWTVLIVFQVAIAVAVLPGAMHYATESLRDGIEQPPPAATKLLGAWLSIADKPGAPTVGERPVIDRPRILAPRVEALIQRLEADPQVEAATFAQRFPGFELGVAIEAEGQRTPGAARIDAEMNRVAPNFFDVYGVPIAAGRRFAAVDARADANTVIVDQTMVDALGGGNVLGRRVRYATPARDGQLEIGPWLEIVGVVPAFAAAYANMGPFSGPPQPRLFHAAAPGDMYPAAFVVQLRVAPAARFAARLRDITASVDPNLRLRQLEGTADTWVRERFAYKALAFGIVAVTMSVLLLSSAGIYAMMSFTVARRRREIGIRTALGADARRVLMGIFGRVGAQIGAGVALGLTVAVAIEWIGGGGLMGGNALVLMPAVVAVMTAVGLLAALGPARRGLAVQPTEALRDE